ncbi:hypothetical protein BDN72DRAFT_126805 [Pluteus cervinus]|uniref:Uncharacterized protein n=1 Tax=Pluteus cervinus TaxID=181527 RepID=A0ACD3ALV0_9AGAR|nr:hypothetical protein BDN72DRAFT_126805 [Pluteus cervinus]
MTTAADLPFELVQEILKFSAWSSSKQAAILARVSHHTYTLIEPILFRTLVYWDEEIYWPYQVDPEWLKRNGRHARNLLFCDDSSLDVDLVLESCPNLINIAIWLDSSQIHYPSFLEPLSQLRPRQLSIDLHSLFAGPFEEKHARLSVFLHLTHLEIMSFSDSEDWSYMEGIQHLPKLTHLSLPRDRESITVTASIVQNALTHCSRLAIIVLFSEASSSTKIGDDTGGVVVEASLPPTIQDIGDPRIVSLACHGFLEELSVGSQGGRNMWTVAEEIVEKRTSIRKV